MKQTQRRIAKLEERLNVRAPKSVDQYVAEAEDLAAFAGISLSEAVQRVFADVSDDELDRAIGAVERSLAASGQRTKASSARP